MARKYGWKPDLPDQRDHLFYRDDLIGNGWRDVDLREGAPPIFNQGEEGSCTANAISFAVRYHLKLEPSRQFIYWNERAMEGTTESDSGARIRDGMKSIAKIGMCPENAWPYSEGWQKRPSDHAYREARYFRATSYQRVNQLASDIYTCLLHGSPVVFGISVYESFESEKTADTGMISSPRRSEQLLGGHAMCCVGLTHTNPYAPSSVEISSSGWAIVANSWGDAWGDKGFCYIPLHYLLSSLASDFWTVYAVAYEP